MNREQRRKQDRKLKKKLTPEQFDNLKKGADFQFIKQAVDEKTNYLKRVFADALEKSLLENGISKTKTMKIVRDLETEIIRNSGGIYE